MSKRDGNVPMSQRQRTEFDCAILKAVPEDLPPDIAQGWIGNAQSLKRALRQTLLPPEPEKLVAVIDADSVAGKFAEEWEKHYCDGYGLKVDFSQVRVPVVPKNFKDYGWLMFVAKGITPNSAYTGCEKNFSCRRYIEDLDAAVKGRNDREPTDHYAIWLRDRQEADEELKNLSAVQLAVYGISGNTLLEGLLLEPWYFRRTSGQHLNVANWNLCSGSRNSDGHVPGVGWRGVGFQVGWSRPGYARDGLCARSAVS